MEVPKATLGIFFSGDSYLVLHNGLDEQAHLHLWVGEHGAGMKGLGDGVSQVGLCAHLAASGRDSS